MRSARTLLLAAVATTAVALTGCSATVTGSPAPTGGSSAVGSSAQAATTDDPVAWADKVCGSLLPFVEASTTEPKIDQNNPAATVKALSDYLGKAVSSIDQSLAGLDAAGPAPVADGDAVVTRLKETLTTVRTSFDKAKTAIDKVDPNNLTELATALPEALAPLQDLNNIQNPTADLKTNPALEAAAAKAPNCQKISKVG